MQDHFQSADERNSKTYLFSDGPIGSGKTQATRKVIAQSVQRIARKTIMAAPTIDLIEQINNDFLREYPGLPVNVVHSESCDNVAAELKQVTEQVKDGEGHVILCTHAGLLQSSYLAKVNDWHLFVDEMPQTTFASSLFIGRNRDVVRRTMTIADSPYEKYSEVVCLDEKALELVATDHSKRGVYSPMLQDIARKVLSPWWTVHVLTEQWKRLMESETALKDGDLLFFGAMDTGWFQRFASVTFLSANVQHTLNYLHMQAVGHEFKQHPHIHKYLQYQEHTNGNLLSIHYAVEGRWSKKLRDAIVEFGGVKKTVNDFIVAAALDLFEGHPFAKLLNKDLERKDPFDEHGEELPHASFGRNDFQHLHNCIVIPALNGTPAYIAYLRDTLGIDSIAAYRAIYLEQIYQATGRISIRNLKDLTPKKIIVADSVAAEFLAAMYPGSSVQRLPNMEHLDSVTKPAGRPRTRSDTDKAEQERARSKRQTWKRKHTKKLLHKMCYIKRFHVATSDSFESVAQAGFAISLWDSRAAGIQREYAAFEPQYQNNFKGQRVMTADEMEAYLRNHIENTHSAAKKFNDLIATALVDLDQDKGHGHTKKNHVVSQGLMLDFDSSELTPEEIHAALRCRMIVYSSWSYAPDNLRYRICIPTAPMTYDAQEALRRMCVRKIEEVYPGRQHKIDMTKLGAIAMFFLPSVREHTMFKSFPGEPIDHVAWLKQCPPDIIDKTISMSPNTMPDDVPLLPPPPAPVDGSQDERIVARAIRVWHERGLGQGQGRPQFWSLAKTLRERTTLQDYEIRSILYEQAGYCHNPAERRAAIDELMRG